MIKAHVELGGQLTVLDLKVSTKKEAIEQIWKQYGIATRITELFDEFDLKAGESDGNTSK